MHSYGATKTELSVNRPYGSELGVMDPHFEMCKLQRLPTHIWITGNDAKMPTVVNKEICKSCDMSIHSQISKLKRYHVQIHPEALPEGGEGP